MKSFAESNLTDLCYYVDEVCLRREGTLDGAHLVQPGGDPDLDILNKNSYTYIF